MPAVRPAAVILLAFPQGHDSVPVPDLTGRAQPIQQCGGNHGVTKDVGPLSEAAVSSHGHGASLVTGIDQLEKQIAPPGWGCATSWWR